MAHELIHSEALPLTPVPPRWVEELFGCSLVRRDEFVGDVEIRTAGPFAHATMSIRDAIHLDASALRNRVAAAYRALIGTLEGFGRHPTRFWNFVPDIGKPMLTGLDRYMVFNAGRYDAYTDWYGPRSIANGNSYLGTASAVGITGSDLLIHCLAMERPGEAVENPRQKPAWQYSTRYGPLPPCFSRAAIVKLGGRRSLLIGGTASVVGEDSRHAGNLSAQVDETLLNLEALVRTARADAGDSAAPLHRVVDLRVYITSAAHAEHARRSVSTRCPHARILDLVVAQLCRRELLVEIEGVAEL